MGAGREGGEGEGAQISPKGLFGLPPHEYVLRMRPKGLVLTLGSRGIGGLEGAVGMPSFKLDARPSEKPRTERSPKP